MRRDIIRLRKKGGRNVDEREREGWCVAVQDTVSSWVLSALAPAWVSLWWCKPYTWQSDEQTFSRLNVCLGFVLFRLYADYKLLKYAFGQLSSGRPSGCNKCANSIYIINCKKSQNTCWNGNVLMYVSKLNRNALLQSNTNQSWIEMELSYSGNTIYSEVPEFWEPTQISPWLYFGCYCHSLS